VFASGVDVILVSDVDVVVGSGLGVVAALDVDVTVVVSVIGEEALAVMS
jgi:hypothetical protein